MHEKTGADMKQTWFNAAWLIALVLGLTLSGVLAFSVWSRLGALDTAQQDQREWLFSQLEVEYLKLVEAVHHVEFDENDDLDDLRKRFDVFYSRVKIAETVSKTISGPINGIGVLRADLDAFIPLIDGPDDALRAQIGTFGDALETRRHVAREIALASIAMDAEASQSEREQIIFLIETLVSAIIFVTAFLIGAIFILFRRSKSLRLATQDAEFTGERLNSMLRASLDAVIVVDEFGTILETNGSAKAVFKYDHDEMLGGSLIDLLVPERYRGRLNSYFENYRSTGETLIADQGRVEWKMIDKAGREFSAEVVATRVRSDEKNMFVTYVRDITDAKEKEAEILQRRDEALAAYKEKSRFFAMMSHEMRTPLNGVISALQLLDDGNLDDTQRKYLAAAETSGDILLGHINDVLAIERIETDEGAEPSPVDIATLTATIFGAMTPFADVSGVRFHLDQAGLDDRLVMTDPRALQQILVNLLSNAIKFSPDGDVTLASRFVDAQGVMVFEVKDTGIGISQEDVQLIFDDFVSLDSSYQRRTGGTGLGLGIVKRQVRRLDGTITCTSELGHGTVFRVELPAQDVTGLHVNSTTESDSDKALGRAHSLPSQSCLVVDDNTVNRELLQAMLEQLGHHAVVAKSGPEAIELAQKSAFDVILMDISMPGMSGIEATQAIISGTGPSRTAPFIAVTAHALPQQRAEFRAAGLSGFIEKPLRRNTLIQVLYESCAGLKNDIKDADNDAVDQDTDLLDMDQISEVIEVIGVEKFNTQLQKFLIQSEQDLAFINTRERLCDIREHVHAFAGACAVMGARQMHHIGRDIQDACDAGASDRVCDLLGLMSQTWSQTRLELQHLVMDQDVKVLN